MTRDDFVWARLAFIGAPGAGKTRLGKRVASRLSLEFIDTDKVIVAEYGAIREIFETYGEAHFRALEREVVKRALRRDAVVSLGGGAVLDPQTQDDLSHVPVVQLTVSAEAVAKRISGGKRPLLRGGIGAWQSLVESRKALYDRLTDRSWDTSTVSLDELAIDVARWATHGDVAEKEQER